MGLLTTKKKEDAPDWGGELWEWGKSLALAFAVVFFVHHFVFNLSTVSGSSMVPTLRDGEWLLVNKLVYLLREPKRGEIVVFREPAGSEEDRHYLVKRIVAVPGDTVEIHDRTLYLNGKPVEEPYTVQLEDGDFGPLKVEEGRYFVLGDNRPVSRDSRTFSTVPVGLIEGRAEFILWPLSQMGGLKAHSESIPMEESH